MTDADKYENSDPGGGGEGRLKSQLVLGENKTKETNRRERTIYRAMSVAYEATLLIGNKANQ